MVVEMTRLKKEYFLFQNNQLKLLKKKWDLFSEFSKLFHFLPLEQPVDQIKTLNQLASKS